MFAEIPFKQIGYAPVEINFFVCTLQGKQSLPEAATHSWVLGEREEVGISTEEFHCTGPVTKQQGRRHNQKVTPTLDWLSVTPRKIMKNTGMFPLLLWWEETGVQR